MEEARYPGFFLCASVCHRLPDVMLSAVSSQLDTHTAEVQAGNTLNVNAFEFWHVRGHSGLVWLTEDLICAPASQDYVERIFSVCLAEQN